MATPLEAPARPRERYDLHDINIDAAAVQANLCGTLDLHTGRICMLPALHPGGCRFETVDRPRLRLDAGGVEAPARDTGPSE